MHAHRRLRALTSGGVLLALVGVWLGHGIEYARVWGLSGLGRGLFGPTHAYMLPVGCALMLCAALLARRALACWHNLARRLDTAARSLRVAFRGSGRTAGVAPPAPLPSWESRILLLAAALAALQVLLYLMQENLEAAVSGNALPGWTVVTGVHWAAAFIQADIAFVLLAAAAPLLSRLRRRASVVRLLEQLVRAVRATLRPANAPRVRALFTSSPGRRFGRAIWSRPPPVPAAL